MTNSGWRLSTGPDVRLEYEPGYGSVVYFGDNGLTGTFLPLAGSPGAFTAPAGFKMDLSGDATAGWTLYDHGSGEKRIFDGSGRLTGIEDRNDNTVSFTYTTAGALSTIVSDVGTASARTLHVTTTGPGAGRITELSQTVTVPDPVTGYPSTESRSVTFAYDSNNVLAGMTDQEGRTTEFLHGGSGNLNRITAPGGGADIVHL